jgi:hypothetical protein
MASYRVLFRCIVDSAAELGVDDRLTVFGHEWLVDEVIPEEEGETILVCTLVSEQAVAGDDDEPR